MRPDRPYVGVGGVVVMGGRIVLIRRGKQPLLGRWVIPGGTVELGETLHEAVIREMQEETGLVVRPREVVLVFDRIQRDGTAVDYHYVVIDYLCDYV
jgi:8-oxo-dGTP diphosphatase